MKKILFHHLPKTAGSSLIIQCQKIYKSLNDARYDIELSPQKMTSNKFSFYHGHYSFNKVREFKRHNPNSIIFTFLRNPLNRVISHFYNKIDESKVIPEIERVKKRGVIENLDEKINHYKNDIFNLSFNEFLDSSSKIAKESRYNRMSRFLAPKALFKQNKELAIVRSKENIKSFYGAFGLMEQMDDSLRLIESKLSLKNGQLDGNFQTNLNKNKKKSKKYSVSIEEMKKLIELNLYDIELYVFCHSLFNKELLRKVNTDYQNIDIIFETGPIINDVSETSMPKVLKELNEFYFDLKLKESKRFLSRHVKLFMDSKNQSHEEYVRTFDRLRQKDQFTKILLKRRNYILEKLEDG